MKFAIVGAGAIGLEHIRNIQILDGSQVTAVADPIEKSQEWAKQILNKNTISGFWQTCFWVLESLNALGHLVTGF